MAGTSTNTEFSLKREMGYDHLYNIALKTFLPLLNLTIIMEHVIAMCGSRSTMLCLHGGCVNHLP